MKQWIQDEPAGLQKQFKNWVEAHPGYNFDQTPLHRHRPTTLFESAVQPVQKHHISGVIWYQGEQNAQNEIQRNWFKKCFPKLIEGFRTNWKQPRLPFYHVQLPGFANEEWPAFRDLQRQYQFIPQTGLAITIDLGLAKDIHPKDKSPIGKRLAKLALKRHYQKLHIVDQGPQIISLKPEGQKLEVEFDKSLSLDSGKVLHFELAERTRSFIQLRHTVQNKSSQFKASMSPTLNMYVMPGKGFPRPIQLKIKKEYLQDPSVCLFHHIKNKIS